MGKSLSTVFRKLAPLSAATILVLSATACGSDDAAAPEPAVTDAAPVDTEAAEPSPAPVATEPVATEPVATEPVTTEPIVGDVETVSIVVTTSILGDVVTAALAGVPEGAVDIETVMPVGSDPHDFQPSARQAETMENADLLVVNGLGLEEGLTGVIDAVADSGTPVFTFTDHVTVLEGGAHEHEHDHAEDEHDHAGEEHDHAEDEAKAEGDDHDHDHSAGDPHLWLDPMSLVPGLEAMADELATLGVDAAAVEASIDAYIDELVALDAELAAQFETIAPERRVLVTNHDSFGYFAARYGFEVAGTVIPSLTTTAEPSAADLEDLVATIEAEQIPAIFVETAESDRLATALADEVGEIAVIEVYTGSLGPDGSGAETYLGMMRTTAALIVDGLA